MNGYQEAAATNKIEMAIIIQFMIKKYTGRQTAHDVETTFH